MIPDEAATIKFMAFLESLPEQAQRQAAVNEALLQVIREIRQDIADIKALAVPVPATEPAE